MNNYLRVLDWAVALILFTTGGIKIISGLQSTPILDTEDSLLIMPQWIIFVLLGTVEILLCAVIISRICGRFAKGLILMSFTFCAIVYRTASSILDVKYCPCLGMATDWWPWLKVHNSSVLNAGLGTIALASLASIYSSKCSFTVLPAAGSADAKLELKTLSRTVLLILFFALINQEHILSKDMEGTVFGQLKYTTYGENGAANADVALAKFSITASGKSWRVIIDGLPFQPAYTKRVVGFDGANLYDNRQYRFPMGFTNKATKVVTMALGEVDIKQTNCPPVDYTWAFHVWFALLSRPDDLSDGECLCRLGVYPPEAKFCRDNFRGLVTRDKDGWPITGELHSDGIIRLGSGTSVKEGPPYENGYPVISFDKKTNSVDSIAFEIVANHVNDRSHMLAPLWKLEIAVMGRSGEPLQSDWTNYPVGTVVNDYRVAAGSRVGKITYLLADKLLAPTSKDFNDIASDASIGKSRNMASKSETRIIFFVACALACGIPFGYYFWKQHNK